MMCLRGPYTNLQASKPLPRLANVFVYQTPATPGTTRLQAVLERRFTSGLSYKPLLAFGRNLTIPVASRRDSAHAVRPIGYNRGPLPSNAGTFSTINGVYSSIDAERDGPPNGAALERGAGRMEASAIYHFNSGQPLVFVVPLACGVPEGVLLGIQGAGGPVRSVRQTPFTST